MLIRQVCRTLRGTGGAGPRPAQGATLFAAAENRELGVGHRPGDRCHRGVSVGATIDDLCSHYVSVAALGEFVPGFLVSSSTLAAGHACLSSPFLSGWVH